MDRDEALTLLRSGPDGIAEWNRRREEGELIPNLSGAELEDANLDGANLQEANLRFANLIRANLRMANLIGAELCHVNQSADIHEEAPASYTNLEGADLLHADIGCANFRNASLRGADLNGASCRATDFNEGDLSEADLSYADLQRAKLCHANLQGVNLVHANLIDAELYKTNLAGARLGRTIIGCDFHNAIGLDRTKHSMNSIVEIQAILNCRDALPESFLQGCGLRNEEIDYFRSVVGKPIRFYSCFISYNTGDEDIATRLHNDFQAAGIRCWKWDHDARTGQSLWGEIDQAIRVHDKLVLIASEASLKSPAVNREIERAIRQEDERQKQKQAGKLDGDTNVLFPVRVDDYIFDGWQHERKVDVTKKVIADACNWTKPKVYKAVLDRLIRDLKPEPRS